MTQANKDKAPKKAPAKKTTRSTASKKSTTPASKRATKTTLKKEQFLTALERSLGVITTASKKVGIDRTTYYKWCNEDKAFEEKAKEIEQVAIDFAESKLYESIKDGNVTSIIFYLKTKGKSRGYTEQVEHKVDEDSRLVIEYVKS